MIIFGGKLAPVNRPFVTRIPGEGERRIQLNKFSLPLASRATVRVEHGEQDVGSFVAVLLDKGWFVGDFVLDPEVISPEVIDRVTPGLALSIGMDIVRSEHDPSTGVEHVLEGRLSEVSIVREAMVPGARITRRLGSSSPAARAGSSDRADVADEVFYGGQRIVRPGIGRIIAVR
jgi:hypothetical protein